MSESRKDVIHPSVIRKNLHICVFALILLIMPESEFHAEHHDPGPLAEEEAAEIAEIVGALSNPARVAVLYALRAGGEMPVAELAEAAGVTSSAASQQLRVLRYLRLVVSRRDGRTVYYGLHDAHVASLLDEVRFHVEHTRLGWTRPPVRRTGRVAND